MRALADMETIQVEITNACVRRCSNCTRFVGHAPKTYFMDWDTFTNAIDSLEGFPGRIGIMGGEPLLHPDFEKMCAYLRTKAPKTKFGLWSTFPEHKKHYREIIVDTFHAVYLNDHTKAEIMHTPLLAAAEEVVQDEDMMWYWIHHCWVQNTWSASINPQGAFFCEVAAAFATLTGAKGWEVKKGWWKKTPKDFVDQMETFCRRCGAAVPMEKRQSTDVIDDISPGNLEMLKKIGSPKVRQGQYNVYEGGIQPDQRKMFSYNELEYRAKVAAKFDLGLIGYLTPYLPEKMGSAQLAEVQRMNAKLHALECRQEARAPQLPS